MNEKPKGKQGFASMDKEKARAIQVMGGKASNNGGRPKGSKNKPQTENTHADNRETSTLQ